MSNKNDMVGSGAHETNAQTALTGGRAVKARRTPSWRWPQRPTGWPPPKRSVICIPANGRRLAYIDPKNWVRLARDLMPQMFSRTWSASARPANAGGGHTVSLPASLAGHSRNLGDAESGGRRGLIGQSRTRRSGRLLRTVFFRSRIVQRGLPPAVRPAPRRRSRRSAPTPGTSSRPGRSGPARRMRLRP